MEGVTAYVGDKDEKLSAIEGDVLLFGGRIEGAGHVVFERIDG